jgi:hypothetical protein
LDLYDNRSLPAAGSHCFRRWFLAMACGGVGAMSMAAAQAQQACGSPAVIYPFPYTDVSAVGTPFCPGIMEAYVTGVSKGTTPTTFSPDETVTRVQMTTFLQRSLDQGLARASRRLVLKQLWTPLGDQFLTSTGFPTFCAADGENIWVAADGQVDQVQASTGKILATWTGPTASWPIVTMHGSIVTADNATPGKLYVIDPTQAPGVVPSILTLPGGTNALAYDGANTWAANSSGSVSIISGVGVLTNYTVGFTEPVGLVYDGSSMWVSDYGAGKLFKVNSSGNIVTTVSVGAGPNQPAFDGENIWVPNSLDSTISVVSASSAKVIATIIPGGGINLSDPVQASFDGERILVTNPGDNSIALFKAADLSYVGTISFGGTPYGACSDGINFWVTFIGTHFLVRF